MELHRFKIIIIIKTRFLLINKDKIYVVVAIIKIILIVVKLNNSRKRNNKRLKSLRSFNF